MTPWAVHPARRRRFRRALAFLCVLALAPGYAAPLLARGFVRAEDRNGDGRADRWLYSDNRGSLRTILVDTNFDGRVDAVERYSGPRLDRRESDRDGDGRIDLVEEFASGSTRTLVDVDRDGVADALLVSTDASPAAVLWNDAPGDDLASEPTDGFIPAPLSDPFADRPSYRPSRHEPAAGHFTTDDPPVVSTVPGIAPPPLDGAPADAVHGFPVCSRVRPQSSRAPPLS